MIWCISHSYEWKSTEKKREKDFSSFKKQMQMKKKEKENYIIIVTNLNATDRFPRSRLNSFNISIIIIFWVLSVFDSLVLFQCNFFFFLFFFFFLLLFLSFVKWTHFTSTLVRECVKHRKISNFFRLIILLIIDVKWATAIATVIHQFHSF